MSSRVPLTPILADLGFPIVKGGHASHPKSVHSCSHFDDGLQANQLPNLRTHTFRSCYLSVFPSFATMFSTHSLNTETFLFFGHECKKEHTNSSPPKSAVKVEFAEVWSGSLFPSPVAGSNLRLATLNCTLQLKLCATLSCEEGLSEASLCQSVVKRISSVFKNNFFRFQHMFPFSKQFLPFLKQSFRFQHFFVFKT